MKSVQGLLLATLVLVSAAAEGAITNNVYITNFNSYTAPGSDIHLQDGWTINDTTDQYSFVAPWNSSRSLGLGDVSAVEFDPTVASVALTHEYITDVRRLSVDFNFAIFDSISDFDPDFMNRDTFGFSFAASTGSLFALYFVPVDATPADPSSELDAMWSISYSINGGATVPLPLAVLEGASYQLSLDFKRNKTNSSQTDFKLGITGGNYAENIIKGLALDPDALTEDFSFLWNQVGSNSYGSNVILVDNLSLVPEPSSTLLISVTALCLAIQRKRR